MKMSAIIIPKPTRMFAVVQSGRIMAVYSGSVAARMRTGDHWRVNPPWTWRDGWLSARKAGVRIVRVVVTVEV